MSPLALTELEAVPEREGSPLVFGKGVGGYSGWSKSKAALDESCGLEPWTLHDLRRTAATRMADLGVLPHVIEAVLNHVSGHKAAWRASTTGAPTLLRSALRSICGPTTSARSFPGGRRQRDEDQGETGIGL